MSKITRVVIGLALALGATSALGQSNPRYVQFRQTHLFGWFLGSGFEYNLGWFPGLFWRTEYRFASYDKDNLSIVTSPGGARTDFSVDSEKFVQTIRSELVWRFNWGGSGRASY
jgi:hypothetical protein